MYHELQMRRALSILLLLLFGLGPLLATLGASEDPRLPACCRRHGAHHCAVSAERVGFAGSPASVIAPPRCPLFPDGSSATPAPVHAVVGYGTGLPVLLVQPHSAAATRTAAQQSQIRTRSGRAPPARRLA
jgi:hypothetical protein